MKIISEANSLYTCGYSPQTASAHDAMIKQLILENLIDSDKNIISDQKLIIKAFWLSDLDVYIGKYRYCSTCKSRSDKEYIHCYSCGKCLPMRKFNDDCVLKSCIKCIKKNTAANGYTIGYGVVGGYINGGCYKFKLSQTLY